MQKLFFKICCLVFSEHFPRIYKVYFDSSCRGELKMNIKKSIILMIIGAAVIGMSLSASAEEDVLPREIN